MIEITKKVENVMTPNETHYYKMNAGLFWLATVVAFLFGYAAGK